MSKKIACVGDTSTHGGTVINSGGNSTLTVNDTLVAIHGALHSCPISGHGTTPISAVITKTFCNGKLVLTEEAVAGCGAKIISPDRGVYVG